MPNEYCIIPVFKSIKCLPQSLLVNQPINQEDFKTDIINTLSEKNFNTIINNNSTLQTIYPSFTGNFTVLQYQYDIPCDISDECKDDSGETPPPLSPHILHRSMSLIEILEMVIKNYLITSGIDENECQNAQFPKYGTFHLETQVAPGSAFSPLAITYIPGKLDEEYINKILQNSFKPEHIENKSTGNEKKQLLSLH